MDQRPGFKCIAAAFVSLLAIATTSAAQQLATDEPSLDSLRSRLKAAKGDHFDWMGDELAVNKQGRGYWLVRLKAKTPGNYEFRCETTYDPVIEQRFPHENAAFRFSFKVGPAGAVRRHYFSVYAIRSYPDVCVGDTLLVPIRVNKDDTKHRFTFGMKELENSADDWDRFKERMRGQVDIRNKAATTLKLLGSGSSSSITRDLGTTCHDLSGIFEMIDSARCNLRFAIVTPKNELKEGQSIFSPGTNVAVEVIDRSHPATVLLNSWMEINYFRLPQSTKQGSVSVTQKFIPSHYILRMGDLIAVHCGEHRVPTSMKDMQHPLVEVTREPFAPNDEPFKTREKR